MGAARAEEGNLPAGRGQSGQPAARLRELTCGYWISQCIAAVAELGIADLIDDAPKHVDELAEATKTKPQLIFRLVRALAGYGIFAEGPERCFALTPMAALLKNTPDSLRGWAILMGQEDQHRAWEALPHALRTGEPAFDHIFGMSYWDHLARNPEAAAIFNAGLTAYTSQVTKAVVAAYDFSGLRRLVDVGAGHGVLVSAILNANPELKAIHFDLPHAREGALRTLGAAGVADRCEVVTGDFFRGVPEGGDAYLLSHVIHDWGDEPALAILRHCRRAMAPKARLLLVESVIPPGNDPFFGKLLDVQMLVATQQGMDRTEREYRALLEKGGFRLARVVPTAADVSVLEGAPV